MKRLTVTGMLALLVATRAGATPVEAPASTDQSRPTVNRSITVRDAVDLALKHSPVIRGAEEEVNMAVARVRMARAATLPSVSATSTFSTGRGDIFVTPAPVMPQNLVNAPSGGFFGQNVALMLPVYTGGRLQALVRQARSAGRAAGADLEAMQRDLALEVKTDYRQVLLARAVADIQKALSDTAQERLRVDRAAFEAGRIPKLNVLRDEAEAADADQMLVNARRDVGVSLVMLKTAIGISQASELALSDKLGYEPFTEKREELLALAQRQRPELAAARQRVAGAHESIGAAHSAYLPQVSLAAMADSMRPQGMPWSTTTAAGVVIGMQIWDGGLRHCAVRDARAGERRAQDQYDQTALQVIQDVETGLLALEAAEHNIRASEAALASAEENYQVAQLRYTEGRGINVEVLDALTALTRARTNNVQALYDFNVARDRLLRAVGGM